MPISESVLSEPSGSGSLNLLENLCVSICKIDLLPRDSGSQVWGPRVCNERSVDSETVWLCPLLLVEIQASGSASVERG